MRICLISSLYGAPGGGSGLAVQSLAQELVSRGHQLFVVTSGGTSSRLTAEHQTGMTIFRFKPANLYPLQDKEVHPTWQKIIWQLVDIYNPLVKSTLRNIFSLEQPELIHIHKMRGFSGAVWTTAAQAAPGHVIQTCHDYECMSPEGTLQGRVGHWALEKKWPLSWYQAARAHFSRGVTVVTAPSEYTLTTVIKSGLFPAARQVVIPNTHGWNSTELDAIRQNAVQADPLHLLYLGRLEPEKGLRELCSAFCSVVPRFPGLHLTIAGWGTLEKELRQSYGSHPNIAFAGKVFGAEKARLLSRISAMIVPSTWAEPSGMVVMEAYAYGKPVIASRIGGLTELITDGKTGWLVEPGNSEALAGAIEAAAQNPSHLRLMSSACFDAAKTYTIEEMINQFENIYLELRTKS